MSIDGKRLRESRAELGWSRQKIVDRANAIAERESTPRITLSAVAVIEQGKREPTEAEAQLLRLVLLEALGRVITEEVPAVPVDEGGQPLAAVTVLATGATRSFEWNGFRRGDPCKVEGERGMFTFQYHHVDDHQEYVEVSGPRMVVQGISVGWKQRSFNPDRIKPATKKRVK